MMVADLMSSGIPGRPQSHRPRYAFLAWLLAILMGLLLGRSFYLQVVRGSDFQLQAEENRVAVVPLPAARGIISDVRGGQLLHNVASTDVMLQPHLLPDEENEAKLFDTLPKFLTITPDELRGQLARARETGRAVLLQRAITHDEAIALASSLENLPGVQLVSSSVRSYVLGEKMAHVLGYTGAAEAETDSAGKAGIEKHYDLELRGRAGAAYQEVDAAARPQKDLGKTEPVPGRNMQLTIDSRLQEHIFSLFQAREEAQQLEGETTAPVAGAVVAMEPATGQIRALVSYPSFDPNIFSQPTLRDQVQAVLHDPLQPLFNRAVAGVYPPGSTIKPLIAAAGLEEHIISRETIWLSSGGIRIGQWFFPDWQAGGHGPTNVIRALAHSVNTFFYLLAGGDETRQGVGVDKLNEYLAAFSWGAPTGIDLPGEAWGLLPSPAWKLKEKNEPWYIGDTYHFGIGQGDVLVTPLQVAAATAAIANGGNVMRPHLTGEGAKLQRLPIADEHLATVREGMRAAVTEGSARGLANLPVAVAGKTGTAQGGEGDTTHAWFTSFGPFEQPELVVTVLLERGGEGDKDAVPFARDIWQWWADNR